MLYPKALTDLIRQEYIKYAGSYRARWIDYHHDQVLFIKGGLGAGKTAGALAYCDLYPNALYFSFKNLDASLAPRVFASQYPDVFHACETWEDFLNQLYDYGVKRHVVIFFDDAGARNDKDEFIQQLQRVLEQNERYSAFVVFLLKPWESLPLRAKERTVKPMSAAELRRVFKLKDEDTFRLYALTGGNPHLLSAYDVNLSLAENMRRWLRLDSRYYRFAQDWLADCFRSPESYNTLMYGMATGRNRVAELSELSGFPNNKVDKYLKALEAHGLIVREKQAGSYAHYSPANNYLLLWFRFLFTARATSDGSFSEDTCAAFMDYFDNELLPATFRQTVLQWLNHNHLKYLRESIDIHAPYMRDVMVDGIRFDYVFKTNEYESRYIIVKLFDRPDARCGKEEWRAIDAAAPTVAPYYLSTLILASVCRFSDYCWEATSKEGNVKLIQIQTLNEVDFKG